MLPASLQRAELELVGAAGSAGGRRSVRGLGPALQTCPGEERQHKPALPGSRAWPPRWPKRGVGDALSLH